MRNGSDIIFLNKHKKRIIWIKLLSKKPVMVLSRGMGYVLVGKNTRRSFLPTRSVMFSRQQCGCYSSVRLNCFICTVVANNV